MEEIIHHASESSMLPSRNEFNQDRYLQLNPDVAAAIEAGSVGSAWQHFEMYGPREGRCWVAKVDPMIGVQQEISPHDEMMFGNELHYFDVGESALVCIEAALRAAKIESSRILKILDLPCGHGRVLRFLKKAFPAAQLTACDLNEDGVAFCAQVFGAHPVPSSVEIANITLPGEYDLIWCGSLLTHLNQVKCDEFMDLLHRSLRPEGVLVFTMHGRSYESEFAQGKNRSDLSPQQIESLLVDYRSDGFGYVDYQPGSAYGFSMGHPTFVRETLVQSSRWNLIGYEETGWDQSQDVISLQKR
jgi:SAM-dependent methyltransferase